VFLILLIVLLPLTALGLLLAGLFLFMPTSVIPPVPAAPLALAVEEPTTVFDDHWQTVTALAFTPDSNTLIVGSVQGAPGGIGRSQIKRWNLTTERGGVIAELPEIIRALGVTPDGQSLILNGDKGEVTVWDLPTGQKRRTLIGVPSRGGQLAIAPDGSVAATTTHGGDVNNGVLKASEIVLWDLAAGKERQRFQGHTGPINALAFSADSRMLASGGADRSVRVWDLAQGKEREKFEVARDAVLGVSFSPDGTTVASGSADGAIWLWDLAGKDHAPLGAAQGAVGTVAFLPDGRRLVSRSGMLRMGADVQLWDIPARKPLLAFAGPTQPVTCLTLSPAGKKLAAGHERTVFVWDVPPGR
jgi:WD40 repeat protein